MSILSTAIDFLKTTNKPYILQTELLEQVSNKTGYLPESVRGTLCKTMGGLYSPKILKSLGFYIERSPTRLVKGTKTQIVQSYNCPIKQSVRSKIFGYVNNNNPTIVTLAGHEGLCVRHALSIFNKPTIHNIEYNAEVLKEYKKLKLPTINHQSSLSDFFKNNNANKDLLFFDAVGYLSAHIAKDLEIINQAKNTDVIALTLLGIKRFRNHGKWVSAAKAKYANHQDPTYSAVVDLMSNYSLVEHIWYKKSNIKGARKMRVFIFKRKGN